VRDGLLVTRQTAERLLGSSGGGKGGCRCVLRRPKKEGVIVGAGDEGFRRGLDMGLVTGEGEGFS
jgi:hypothetical protein